jgi:hypothetical protein
MFGIAVSSLSVAMLAALIGFGNGLYVAGTAWAQWAFLGALAIFSLAALVEILAGDRLAARRAMPRAQPAPPPPPGAQPTRQ